jgi:dienelactone hydrolase
MDAAHESAAARGTMKAATPLAAAIPAAAIAFAMAISFAATLGLAPDPVSARPQAATCLQQPGPACLYAPDASYGFTAYERLTSYIDRTGVARDVPMTIRVPVAAPAPMPVVIWSHGGAGGHLSSTGSMREWSETTARAGYFTIALAHRPRDAAGRQALCQAIGTIGDAATCEVFKYLNWDRPHDLRAVVDEVERMATVGDFAGQIDITRIAVGGHSAGAGGALTVAGARRGFGGAPLNIADRRPVAFLAFSPQQPGNEGFFDTDFGQPEHSWIDLDRPVLVGTGDGDRTCQPGPEPGSCIGEMPYGRRIAFERLPAVGNKAMVYVHDVDAFHTLFALESSRCQTLGVDPAKCTEMIRWVTAAALAFLDGQLRRIPGALQWLASDRLQRASNGVAEWRLR